MPRRLARPGPAGGSETFRRNGRRAARGGDYAARGDSGTWGLAPATSTHTQQSHTATKLFGELKEMQKPKIFKYFVLNILPDSD